MYSYEILRLSFLMHPCLHSSKSEMGVVEFNLGQLCI